MANISELKNAGVKGSIWNFLTSIIGQLRSFIVSIVLARLLTPNDFGIIAIAMVFNGLIETLIDFGFSNAIVQKKYVSQVQKSTIFYINILLGGIFTIALFLCAPIMEKYFAIENLANVVRFTSFAFIIASFSTVQTSLFQKDLDFKSPFKARVSSSIISGISGIVMALCGFGVWALVFSNLIAWVLNSLIIWRLSKWRPSFEFNLSSVKDLWNYGWKMTITTFFNRIYTQLDTFIIGKLFSASALGYYNRAQSLNRLVIDYSFSSIRSVLLPTFSKLQDEIDKFKISAIKLLNVICFLNFLFSGLMYISADDIILLLYGNKWIDSVPIFRILAIFSLHLSLPVLYDTIMSALSKMNMYLWVNILRKPVLLLSIPIGIFYGFYYYVWAINILYFVSIVPLFWSVKRCIGLGYREHITIIVKYCLPFIILSFIFLKFRFTFHYHLFNIIANSLLYAALYIGYAHTFKFDGYSVVKGLVINNLKKLRLKKIWTSH